MNNESDKYILFSTVVSILLTISELLPYIKGIKSNGIIELIIELCIFFLKKKKNGTGSNDESVQLLEDFLEERINENENENENKNVTFSLQNAKLIYNKKNMIICFDSPNEIKII
jgi:hypothetical protein